MALKKFCWFACKEVQRPEQNALMGSQLPVPSPYGWCWSSQEQAGLPTELGLLSLSPPYPASSQLQFLLSQACNILFIFEKFFSLAYCYNLFLLSVNFNQICSSPFAPRSSSAMRFSITSPMDDKFH